MHSLRPDFPQQRGRGYRYRQAASIALVLALQCVFVLFLILGLRLSPPREPASLLVTMDVPVAHIKPELLKMPKFVAPPANVVTPPQFEIASPESALSPAQGPAPTLEGRGGGGGGVLTRREAALPLPPDPICETIQAYATRLRDHVQNNMVYSKATQVMRIEGDITMNIVSDPQGNVISSSIGNSIIDHTEDIHGRFGGVWIVVLEFTSIFPNQWGYSATATAPDTGKIVNLDRGTIIANSDGVLTVVNRPSQDPTSLAFTFPAPTDTVGFLEKFSVKLGNLSDMRLLYGDAIRTLAAALPLPPIPSCLKLQSFKAAVTMHFRLMADH